MLIYARVTVNTDSTHEMVLSMLKRKIGSGGGNRALLRYVNEVGCNSQAYKLLQRVSCASMRLCMRKGRASVMVLKLLDEIQQYRLESNVISLNAVRHARREGSWGRCYSCWMRYSSAGLKLM